MEETRVFLVKPGDVLLIGNVGAAAMEELDSLGEFFQKAGIKCTVFNDDIQLDLLSAEQLNRLVAMGGPDA